MPIHCYICTDEIEVETISYTATEYYHCPCDSLTSPNHAVCLPCFRSYMEKQCKEWSTLSFPIKSLSCYKNYTPISEQSIRSLLPPSLIALYENASVQCALSAYYSSPSDSSTADIPFNCRHCYKYTILLPSNHKAQLEERAVYQRRLEIRRQAADSLRREWLEQEKKRAEREAKEQQEIKEYQEKRVAYLNSLELTEEQKNESKNEAQLALELVSTLPFSSFTASTATAPSPLLPLPPLPLTFPISSSEEIDCDFLICPLPDCHYSTCYRCQKTLPTDTINTHTCAADKLEKLRSELVEVLVRAVTRKCPKCGAPGTKDNGWSQTSQTQAQTLTLNRY